MSGIESIRTVKIEDVPMILDIYSYYVDNTPITFEITSPDIEEMKRRVMETYAYYSKFRDRKAYDYSCETTVYVHKDFLGKGIGCALYGQLINGLKKTSKAVAIGAIALPNEGSVKLHEKFGFKNVGILKNVGRKFNKWIDVGYWELELKNIDEYCPEKESWAKK